MKDILFICDPLTKFKIKSDTTYFFMETFAKFDHQIFYATPSELFLTKESCFVKARKLTLITPKNHTLGLNDNLTTSESWYKEEQLQIMHLTKFDAIFIRIDPPFDMEFFYLTQILTQAEKKGAKIYNSSYSLRNFNEKLAILNFPNLITPTIVTKNKNIILEFLTQHENCVLKPIDQMAGRSVFKISLTDVNYMPIIETVTNYFTTTVMVQKFIPEVMLGDKRIFIIKGVPVEYCLNRIPQHDQIRSNLAVGGTGVVQKLTATDKIIANEVASWLNQNNIFYAGLDVIGDNLTEINITSPTGARQIFEESNINIGNIVLENI